MHRTTIAIDDDLAAALDAYMESTGAANRSEAIRDLVRRGLSARREAPADAHCVGVVSCVIDQSVRNLAARVPRGRLDRHDETVAVLSAPLDHTTSIDVMLMRGHVGEVSAYAEALFAERGILHGALSLVPVAEERSSHAHPQGSTHEHSHLKVLSGF
ncbi:CopG family nickel-responsive transcriptional regulator [Ancylobacter sp. 3268]|uniref:nickel-responsive transcriptional regulator NikR n=1 Tax=Ancylobacter sp. 3268 TaxID=2817752 RepID=UPI00285B165B|nr:nickel-responsive transcriptional regulator NikR [Ancylobacter sp. 3268]MDR6952368.1 CopG family nickel-responsive transcriptional regulator [Ancylobacter sp. 3268]MDR6955729.1 CopG family nickel-responsive transcriptional regulator [Ancylobacter sp. 3268]